LINRDINCYAEK